MSTNKKSTAAVPKPTTNARFTIADLAREKGISPKIARRRMRDALRRKPDETPHPLPSPDNVIRDARLRHEYAEDTKDAILAIISRD
jgi:hypothetical protein